MAAMRHVPIQIVLTHHESKESLADAVDFAVCGVIFDGSDVLVTEAAKFELENMAIVVKANNLPDQKRVEKYYGKGFDFIFPHLDINKIPRHYLKLGMNDAIETERLAFAYSAIDGNKITLDRFLNGQVAVPVTRYDSVDSAATSREVIYKNIEALCKGENEFMIFAEADFIGRVLDIWPKIGPRQVENTFPGIKSSIFDGDSFNFAMYKKYVTEAAMKDVLMKMCDSKKERMKPLEEAINRQMNYCKERITVLNEEFKDRKLTIYDESVTFPKRNDLSCYYGKYLLSTEE
jgi:hypothetical protein